jgi:hypothetical protein
VGGRVVGNGGGGWRLVRKLGEWWRKCKRLDKKKRDGGGEGGLALVGGG